MKTSLLPEIKTAIQIALFKDKDMHHIAADKHKTNYAYYIIGIAAALGFIGSQLFMPFNPSIGVGIGMAAMQFVMTVIGIYVLSGIAKAIFKGSASHDAFFRVMAYSMVITFLSMVPLLGLIVAIWGLILVFTILKVVHKLTTGGAIGTILVSILVMGIISMIVSPALGKIGLGYPMGGKYNVKSFGGYNKIVEMDFNTEEGEGNIEIEDEDNFEMNVPGSDGGSIKMEDGTMTITGPDGEVMEITIPQ